MSKKDRGKSTSASPLADRPARVILRAMTPVARRRPPCCDHFAGKKDDEEEAEEQKDAGEKIDNRVETAEIELAPIAPMSNPKTRHKNDQITWRPQQSPPPSPPHCRQQQQ